ncbi:hypothetical protein PPERSA_06841 [Pseudocohnilembus persalinus]|uniref:Uncharacterized protein n=1 Tax=Pseudocohnilembus persalinus TaxID=266149 RepID=A0A0V0QSP4_PSEPJ|nr:hypothetical protein PPERSA_06841 [Pseudocohnilembus persalinus]|eukprot:KRX05207.1 hypothetical protein PPERSA_06841 [Pseudocohnilembus persalinus]
MISSLDTLLTKEDKDLFQYQLNCVKLELIICGGGYIETVPEKYYWREKEGSYEFYQCQTNLEACTGNDTCQTGYTGTMCEECDFVNEYYLSQDYKCEKCPEWKKK